MPVYVSTTDPGWPDQTTDEVFAPIKSSLRRVGETHDAPISGLDENGDAVLVDFPIPAATSEQATTQIDTQNFEESDASDIICAEPPFEPVNPPLPGIEPGQETPPIDWNPPVIIPDPEVVIPDPIAVTVTVDSKTVCINADGYPELTQTEEPAVGGTHESPYLDGAPAFGDIEVGDTFPIHHGDWTPPNDGNVYSVSYIDGTLTVKSCNSDLEEETVGINVDTAICAAPAGGGYFVVEDQSGCAVYADTSQDGASCNLDILAAFAISLSSTDESAYRDFDLAFYINGALIDTQSISASVGAVSIVGFPSPYNSKYLWRYLGSVNEADYPTEKTISFLLTETGGGGAEGATSYVYKKTFDLKAKFIFSESNMVWNRVNSSSSVWSGTATREIQT